MKETRIVCAAIRHRIDGTLILGARHFDHVMIETINKIQATTPWYDAEQGFIDQHGTFRTREEAYVIAHSSGQIIYQPTGYNKLFSEDLY